MVIHTASVIDVRNAVPRETIMNVNVKGTGSREELEGGGPVISEARIREGVPGEHLLGGHQAFLFITTNRDSWWLGE